MKICSNCGMEIKKDFVICSSCGKHLHKKCANTCIECGVLLCDECSIKNKFKCNNCKEKSKYDFKFIRRSHIELYKVCPYSFYLEVIKKAKTENNIYAEVGIILHDIFDKHSIEPEKYNEDIMTKMFEEQYFKLKNHYDIKLKPELYESLHEVGINCIKNIIPINSAMVKPFVTEDEMFFIINDELPKVRITCDRINQLENGLQLIDYKTGRVYSGKKLEEDFQVSTYIIATETKYKQPVVSFKFLFLNENKEREYIRKNDNEFVCTVRKNEYTINLNKHIEEITKIFEDIMNNKFNIPNNIREYWCNNFCYFGKTQQCKGSQQERWNLSNDKKN